MQKIFIGGCDRSGTTFLASLLASYKGVIVGPETQFKVNIQPHDLTNFTTERLMNGFSNSWRFKHWFPDFEDVCNRLELFQVMNYESLIDSLVSIYADQNFGIKAKYWVDHTPNNFEYFDFFEKNLSSVKYIHIYRDGRAVAASLMAREWGPNTPEAAAIYWLTKLSYPFAAQAMQPEKVFTVCYEDLVRNTDYEIQRIITFCDFDSEIVEKKSIILPKFSLNQHSLVNKKPNKQRLDAWKYQMTQSQIAIFNQYAGCMLTILGYKTNCSNRVSVIKIAQDRFLEFIKKHINRRLYKKIRNL